MRMGRVWVMIAATLALASGTSATAQQSPSPQQRAVLVGTVTDSATGAPVPGATVTFERARRTVFADPKGAFSIKLPEGPESVTVEQLGYRDGHVALVVNSGMAPRTLRLAPDPVALKSIEVINRGLRNRSAAIVMSVRSFQTNDLSLATAWNVRDYLDSRGAYFPLRCPRAAFTTSCIWSRGQVVAPRVWLDNNPLFGGLDELATIPVHDIYRVDVFQRGVYIQVFTKWWMERALRTHESAILPY